MARNAYKKGPYNTVAFCAFVNTIFYSVCYFIAIKGLY